MRWLSSCKLREREWAEMWNDDYELKKGMKSDDEYAKKDL